MEKSYRHVKNQALRIVIVTSLLAPIVSASVEVRLAWLGVNNHRSIYYPGSPLDLSAALENEGDETSDDFTVDFFVVNAAGQEYFLTSATRSGLTPGEWRQIWVPCTVPLDIPEGYYGILKGTATCSNDDDPANNAAVTQKYPLRVLIPYPNLQIVSVNVPRDCFPPGGPVPVTITIKNLGTRNPGTYSIDCYVVTNGAPMMSGYHVASYTSGTNVDPGETATTTTECHLPSEMTEGEYVIWAHAICSDDTNPANNIGKTRPVWVSPFPDLAVQLVDVADGAYAPGGQIIVQSVVQNIGDRISDSYTIQYYLSQDTSIASNDTCIGSVDGVGLAPGQQSEDTVTCQLPLYFPEGSAYIGARVSCATECNSQNNVGMDTIPIRIVVEHPTGYVSGQVTYKTLEGKELPVRYAWVRVYDVNENSSQVGDRVIGESHTDQDGSYSVLIPMDDERIQQIRVRAFTQVVKGDYPETTSGICSVKDDVNHNLYVLRSPLYPRPQEGPLTVNMTAPKTGGEFMVFDSVIEGFHKARTFFGLEPNEIVTYWPSADNETYYDPNSGIHIAKGDRSDRDVIMHEYGHYIAEICEFAQGQVGDDPRHYWNRDLRYQPSRRTAEEAQHLAFREAWATLFSVATQYSDTWYPYSGGAFYHDYDESSKWMHEIDLESETRNRPACGGEFFENMSTAALWDIFDDKVDGSDTLNDPSLSRTWAVMHDAQPADIHAFANDWIARFACTDEMTRIFTGHGMSLK